MNLNLPINSVSFGQVSTAILRGFKNSGESVNLFEIGKVDVSSQAEDASFLSWLDQSIKNARYNHSRNSKVFKLWHLHDSLASVSNEQHLLSFYELDAPTQYELNIARNNVLYFSSQYTVDVFNAAGAKAEYMPLFFDEVNFHKKDKKYFDDGRIVFNLVGKFEKRKHHAKVLKAWANKFGNDKRYFLQCSIFNPFLSAQDNETLINNALEGKKYFNISFLPFMQKNSIYNDYLNSSNIVIGMSGGEGWGLPEFQSVGIGKYAVILNCNGYKSWANSSNSILVEPTDKIDAYDGMFFKNGSETNQGQIFDFNPDDFVSACEKAIAASQSNPVNENGLKIQQDFKLENTLNFIKNKLNA
jgi:hypothetical protein